MESYFSAWPFLVLACLIGLGLIATGLIGIPVALPQLDFSLLTKTIGILPSAKLRWLASGVLLAIILLTLLFWSLVKAITDDYLERVAEAKDGALAPITSDGVPNEDPVECAVRYYREERGFAKKTTFESTHGEDVVLMSKFEQDQNQIWRSEGVLVYPNAESIRFSVGVIYGEGAWVENSSRKIHRSGLRRRVNLETVLEATSIRELSDRNDYLLTLGLASNAEGEDALKNCR